MILFAIILFSFLPLVCNSQEPLPCILNNGCVCDHSLPYLNPLDFQYYGTCVHCNDTQFTGPTCLDRLVACHNLGHTENQSCVCPSQWTGSDCGVHQCVNTINGTGPSKIAPPSRSNFCDRCINGTTGLSCDMCTTNEGCSDGALCWKDPAPVAGKKQLFCNVTDGWVLDQIEWGPRHVQARVVYSCESPTNFVDSDGTCGVTFYRVEPNDALIDPFFYCTGFDCSVEQSYQTSTLPQNNDQEKKAIDALKYFGEISLLSLCFLLSVVRYVPLPKNYQNRAVKYSLLLLVASLSIYIFSLYGLMKAAPTVTHRTVSYNCQASACGCAPPPENLTVYPPSCNETKFAEFVLPNIKHVTTMHCDVETMICQFLPKDTFLSIDLTCEASECVPHNATASILSQPENGLTPSGIGAISASAFALICLFFHLVWTLCKTDKAKRDFSISMDSFKVSDADSDVRLHIDNIAYRVRSHPWPPFVLTQSNTRQILSGVSLSASSGDIIALMGCSGAGKTTFLDIIAARTKSGVVTGSISLNGTLVSKQLARNYRLHIGYVAQEDALLPHLTVQESIFYAARLKLPSAFSNATVDDIVTDVISSLRLERCKDTTVGDGITTRGLSGGEKRRVSIAVELVANPRILFLDEPTTGLDAANALQVMEVLQMLSKHSPLKRRAPHFFYFNPIIIASIHQPSTSIFRRFTHVLLLSQGGTAFWGTTVRAMSLHKQWPTTSIPDNPAEFLLSYDDMNEDQRDVVSQSSGKEPGEKIGHSQCERFLGNVERKRFYANSYDQTFLLIRRAYSSLMGAYYLVTAHGLVAFFVGLLMIQLYKSQALTLSGSLNRAGSITFLLLIQSFTSLSVLEQLMTERKIFVTERENGYYTTIPYLVSKVVVDILPLRIVPASIISSLIYFPMGLRTDSGSHFMWFVVIVLLFTCCMTMLVVCIGLGSRSFGAAVLISAVVILWNFVFGGLLVQAETIPSFFNPFKNISPFYFAFESLMTNELQGQKCVFSPTDDSGQPSTIVINVLCTQYLYNLGLDPSRFSNDVLLLAVELVVFFFLSGFLMTFVSVSR